MSNTTAIGRHLPIRPGILRRKRRTRAIQGPASYDDMRHAPGSLVAFDFKIAGVKDDFGRGGRTEKPFLLTTS